MIIDWHTHVHPLHEQAERFWNGNCPATIENVLRLHDEVGLDLSVISSAGHWLKNFSREEALPKIRESNEYLAFLRDAHKDKLVAIAVAIPGGGDAHLKELERAVKEDDLRGVLINSSHRRTYPDDDDARPFFQLATELDIPVFMHPPSVGFWRGTDEGVPARIERRPAVRRLPRAGAPDREGHFRGLSKAQARGQPPWRRHLRGHRPDGLRLRAARQSVDPRSLRSADLHHAQAERLFCA